MSVLLVLIPASIILAAAFLAAFIWAVRSGQYEDTCTPTLRVLLDETPAGMPVPPGGRNAGAPGGDARSSRVRDGTTDNEPLNPQ